MAHEGLHTKYGYSFVQAMAWQIGKWVPTGHRCDHGAETEQQCHLPKGSIKGSHQYERRRNSGLVAR
jgi:hypothetical protein